MRSGTISFRIVIPSTGGSPTAWPLRTPHQKVPVNSTWHTPHWAVITETACHNHHKSPCISTQTKNERESLSWGRHPQMWIRLYVSAVNSENGHFKQRAQTCKQEVLSTVLLWQGESRDSTKDRSSQSRTRIWYTIVPSLPSPHTHTHTKHNPPKTSALMGPTTVITRHIFGIRHLSSQLKVAPKTKSSVIIVCLLSLFLVLSMSFSLTWVTCHPSYFFVRSLLFLLDFLLNPCLEGALAVLAECRSWWMRCTFQPAGAPWRHNT